MGTYKEVANLENITPQAVCDTLRNIRALEIKYAEENLIQYFSTIHSREFSSSTTDMET